MRNKLLIRKKVNPSDTYFTGVKQMDTTEAQLFVYSESGFSEMNNFSIEDFQKFNNSSSISWLNIHGIHNADLIKEVCKKLDVHDLAIQDILDVNQRPKFQKYESHWVITIKSIAPTNNNHTEQEQISFVLGGNYLVSFQERKADYFNHIRERIRKNIGIVRGRGSDYLLFLLLEAILDNYFKVLNEIESNINKQILFDIDVDPSPNMIKSIELYKRQVHEIKKTVSPIKDFITKIEREEFSFVVQNHVKYYQELKDLCLTLIDDCDQLEVKLESNSNLFFSIQGHRMNQVMKTLTVVSAIFIPMTFIAGIYGMNFNYIPELQWEYGYFIIWIVLLIIFIGLLVYFKMKKWF